MINSPPGPLRAPGEALFLAQEVTLDRLEVLELVIPQVESFRSAIGVRTERRALFVRWFDKEGRWGLGECSCRPDPFFSGEFVDGARLVLRDHVFPRLPLDGTIADIITVLNRVRGWPFTVSAVLDAVCDLLRRRGEPDLLEAWDGPRIRKVPVGISLGLFSSAEAAVQRVEKAVAEGYHRVKLKITPTMDRRPLDAIRANFPNLHLGFDANGSGGDSDLDFFTALAQLTPAVLEQPFPPDRLDLCLKLKDRVPDLRICLDESVASFGDLLTAHRLGALDELNIKPGRVGGPLATARILTYCRQHQIPAWVGGMFETGVGRLANLRLAARLPEATAHDLSPSRRYFKVDVVTPEVKMGADGTVDLGEEEPPAIDEAAVEELLVKRMVLSKETQDDKAS
jgi:O-succinylbenzoate synthase